MKRLIAMMLAVLMVAALAACGTSNVSGNEAASGAASAPAEPSATPDVGEDSAEVEIPMLDGGEELTSVEMLYYKKLDNGSIMAAACTEEDIALLGEDYYVVHVGEAVITKADGEVGTLDDLVRGCHLEIKWPGMVMQSYPSQIAAVEVIALTDEADPAVPAEDEIKPVGNGPAWWETEIPADVPALVVDYLTDDYQTFLCVEHHSGQWFGGSGEGGGMTAGITNSTILQETPLNRQYDESNTLDKTTIRSITLSAEVMPDEMTVKAYVLGGEDVEHQEIELDANNSFVPLPGEVIYQVLCKWNNEAKNYSGEADYSFKVVQQ